MSRNHSFLNGSQTHLAFYLLGTECKVVAAQTVLVTLHVILWSNVKTHINMHTLVQHNHCLYLDFHPIGKTVTSKPIMKKSALSAWNQLITSAATDFLKAPRNWLQKYHMWNVWRMLQEFPTILLKPLPGPEKVHCCGGWRHQGWAIPPSFFELSVCSVSQQY